MYLAIASACGLETFDFEGVTLIVQSTQADVVDTRHEFAVTRLLLPV